MTVGWDSVGAAKVTALLIIIKRCRTVLMDRCRPIAR
jgi:hypothetical protein